MVTSVSPVVHHLSQSTHISSIFVDLLRSVPEGHIREGVALFFIGISVLFLNP
jgi:hypothetical protein